MREVIPHLAPEISIASQQPLLQGQGLRCAMSKDGNAVLVTLKPLLDASQLFVSIGEPSRMEILPTLRSHTGPRDNRDAPEGLGE